MISMLKIHETVEYEKLYMELLKLIRCLLLSTNIPKEDLMLSNLNCVLSNIWFKYIRVLIRVLWEGRI